jgi:hypothetical protein
LSKQEKIKGESKKRNRRSLPPTRIGAAPLCLSGGTAAVEAAHHIVWGCALFGEKKTEIGKDSRAKRLGGELGAPTVSFYRPGKTDRGPELWLWIVAHIPRKSEGGKVSLASPPAGRLEF